MMNPYLQALLRLVHAQQLTPGGDEVMRPRVLAGKPSEFWGAASDPGIYGTGKTGSGVGYLGQPGSPVMPPQPMRSAETNTVGQLPIARNVLRGLEQGQDVNLTGSGLELSPAELAGQRSALDMLLQHLRAPQTPMMGW